MKWIRITFHRCSIYHRVFFFRTHELSKLSRRSTKATRRAIMMARVPGDVCGGVVGVLFRRFWVCFMGAFFFKKMAKVAATQKTTWAEHRQFQDLSCSLMWINFLLRCGA